MGRSRHHHPGRTGHGRGHLDPPFAVPEYRHRTIGRHRGHSRGIVGKLQTQRPQRRELGWRPRRGCGAGSGGFDLVGGTDADTALRLERHQLRLELPDADIYIVGKPASRHRDQRPPCRLATPPVEA